MSGKADVQKNNEQNATDVRENNAQTGSAHSEQEQSNDKDLSYNDLRENMTKEENRILSTTTKKIFQKVLNESKQSICKKPKKLAKTRNEILQKKIRICEKCNYQFSSNSALGGHLARVHPGESRAFNHKKGVRARRELERLLHKEALDAYK